MLKSVAEELANDQVAKLVKSTKQRRLVDAPEVQPRKGRCRVSNGKVLLPDVSGNSPWVRRCKDVIAMYISDLGGISNVSTAKQSIIRRVSVMTVELERLESKFAKAGEATDRDLDLYQRSAGNLRRLLQTLGLERLQRDVTTFSDVLRANARRQHEE